MKLADIYRQLCEVYEENSMSDSMARKWVRRFNEARENVHDKQRISRDIIRALPPQQPSGESGYDDDTQMVQVIKYVSLHRVCFEQGHSATLVSCIGKYQPSNNTLRTPRACLLWHQC